MQSPHTDEKFPLNDSARSESEADPNQVSRPPHQVMVLGGIFRHHAILTVETTEGGQFLVTDELFGSTYGVGDDLDEAVDDYASMLQDYFRELSDSKGDLSSYLRHQLRMLENCLLPLD